MMASSKFGLYSGCLGAFLLCNLLLAVVHAQSDSDPCATLRCANGSICQIVNGKAKCQCGKVCPQYVLLVCATNGKNYTNICYLQQATCNSQGKIQLAHNGPCASTSTTSKSGSAPDCPNVCPELYDPICGTNGQTYGNSCFLNIASCKSNGTIKEAYAGKCIQAGSSTPISASASPTSGQSSAGFKRLCPSEECTKQYEPVCGTNGKTYNNSCYLSAATCLSNGAITEAHEGECEPTGNQAQGSPGLSAASVGGRRLCPSEACTKEYAPVCGTNGKTYGNSCLLSGATCLSNGTITLAYQGACENSTTGVASCSSVCSLICSGQKVAQCKQGTKIITTPPCSCPLEPVEPSSCDETDDGGCDTPSCSSVCSLICSGQKVAQCKQGTKIITTPPCLCPRQPTTPAPCSGLCPDSDSGDDEDHDSGDASDSFDGDCKSCPSNFPI